MSIAGFGFTKIVAEKKEVIKGNVSIKNNVSIKDVEKTEVPFGKAKQPVLKFTFEYRSDFEPGIGSIVLEGNLLDLQEAKVIDTVMAKWNKEKKLDTEFLTPIINAILTRCNVESLIQSREVNLPPPVPLPKVNVQQPGEKK